MIANRRRFLSRCAAGWVALAGSWTSRQRALAARRESDSVHGPIRITDIEIHDIMVDYVDWIAYPLNHYYGPTRRTIYVVRTNNGLVGLGEGEREPDRIIQKYIGTSPFDWVGDENSLPLAKAMYDLMGKAAGVPVYKLLGQRHRSWVPVGSWTVSTHPDRMAEAVERYAEQGYTWLKYHPSPFENVFDQTEAMEKVAPSGFRIHYDFTQGGTDDHMPDLLARLSRSRIAGCFEDPLPNRNLDGYVELRKQIPLPIAMHASPLGKTYEVFRRAADAYMMGHAKIGVVIRRAGLFAAAEAPFMVQNVGGHITRAMSAHIHAAFKTSFFHFFTDAETWKLDVVKERLLPVNGMLRVPEKPGLGVTLDPQELERLKSLKLPEQPKWILKTSYDNGTVMYNIADPKSSLFMVRPNIRRQLPILSYDAPVSTEYWDDDGSPEYRAMFNRLEKEGVVITRG